MLRLRRVRGAAPSDTSSCVHPYQFGGCGGSNVRAVGEVRLAELMASLSLATDLGTAFPLEKALRNALLAVELGRAYGLSEPELSDAYYVAMLRFLGCTAY